MKYDIRVKKTRTAMPERTGKVIEGIQRAVYYCAGYNTALRDIGHRACAVVVDERGRVVWPL